MDVSDRLYLINNATVYLMKDKLSTTIAHVLLQPSLSLKCSSQGRYINSKEHSWK